jgi:solute carrier family 25 aspartate/glutamate transporter 12/13
VGFISLSNFKQRFEFQSAGEGDDVTSQVAFNYDCDIIKRFFGPDGKRRLRYPDFTQFFIELQDEIVLQAFQHFDKKGNGFVSYDDFMKLVRNFGGWRIPPGFQDRLNQMQSLNSTKPKDDVSTSSTTKTPVSNNPVDGSSYTATAETVEASADEKLDENKVLHSVSYAQFCAFNGLLNHLPVVCNTIDIACKMKGGPINKDDFKMGARQHISHGTAVSPVMTDVLFSIFDQMGEGHLNNDGVQNLLKFGSLEAPEEKDHSHGGVDTSNMTTVELFKHKLIEFVEHFALGGIAGGIGAMAVYPIDLVKTRMQNQIVKPGVPPQYANFVDCFKKVIGNEGFFALYRGLGAQLVGVAPEKAIKLTMNDMLRDAFTSEAKVAGKKGEPTIYFPLEVLAGCGAGGSQVVFTNPLEIVKIRMQVQGVEIANAEERIALAAKEGKPTTGMVVPARQSAGNIIKELGFMGLYKGAGACFLRDIPFSGLYFPAYAEAKKVFPCFRPKLSAQNSHSFIRPVYNLTYCMRVCVCLSLPPPPSRVNVYRFHVPILCPLKTKLICATLPPTQTHTHAQVRFKLDPSRFFSLFTETCRYV